MFKATITNGKLLELISRTAEFVEDGTIQIKQDGLSFVGVDRGMVCAVGWKLNANAFDSYELDEETKMSVNFGQLLTVLKRTSGKSNITLELDKQLKITIVDDYKRFFSIPLLELGEEEIPPIENLEFTTTAEIKADVFANGIEDSEAIGGDSIVFSSDGLKRFFMKTQTDTSSAELDTESRTSLAVAKARYPNEYLKKIAKTKLSETVLISYGEDSPARFTYKNEKAEIWYVLAPRVEE
jgi:DNA polymerase III sliding clamp (beta) subunit (PCNA family)